MGNFFSLLGIYFMQFKLHELLAALLFSQNAAAV
jgi:hypothetical protein